MTNQQLSLLFLPIPTTASPEAHRASLSMAKLNCQRQIAIATLRFSLRVPRFINHRCLRRVTEQGYDNPALPSNNYKLIAQGTQLEVRQVVT